MRSILIAVLLIAGSAGVAQAEVKAEDLLRECQGRGKAGDLGRFVCTGYFLGATGAWTLAGFLAKQEFYCPPKDGISAEQAQRIYEKWATDHPADLHQPARLVAFLAMRDAFPCQR
jgi:hypothetical protein